MLADTVTETDTATASWSQLLDELEADIRVAQDVLVGAPGGTGVGQWSPPSDLGPMPESLRARAQAVVNLQQALSRSLADAQDSTRAHLRVVETVSQRNAPQAVYLDTLG